jgi:hypothetical protein
LLIISTPGVLESVAGLEGYVVFQHGDAVADIDAEDIDKDDDIDIIADDAARGLIWYNNGEGTF